MNRKQLRARANAFGNLVKGYMENDCSIEVEASLIKEDFVVRRMVQKSLSDFADLGVGPASVTLPCHFHVTIHPVLVTEPDELEENARNLTDYLDNMYAW